MAVYLLTFSIAGALVAAYERSERAVRIGRRRLALRGLLLAGIALLLSLLAGLRAVGVGVDTVTYAVPEFRRVRRIASLSTLLGNMKMELGYELLVFLCTRISGDYHLLFFATELLICAPLCWFVARYPARREEAPMLFLAWLLIYYTLTYNEMRQWIAMAFGLCAACLALEGKPVRACLAFLTAWLFHQSAVVLPLLYLLHRYLQGGRNGGARTLLLLGAAAGILLGLEPVLRALISWGVLDDRYLHYVVKTQEASSAGMQLLSKAPVLIGFTALRRELCERDARNRTVYAFLLLDALICSAVGRFGFAALRLSQYFGIWQCAAIAELHEALRRRVTPGTRWMITAAFVAILLAYWLYYYAYRGFGNSVPYRTDAF